MDDVQLAERLARIESGLEAVKSAIEFGDRSGAQLVQMLAARVDNVSNDVTRVANAAREAEDGLRVRLDDQAKELESLTLWKAKVAGMALAFGSLSGVATALIVRSLGG